VQFKLVIIHGKSSDKKLEILLEKKDLESNLLTFLQKKGFPIASSCRGEMVCQKCILSTGILSCSLTLDEFLTQYGNTIEVDYL
jgi:ferredoxin